MAPGPTLVATSDTPPRGDLRAGAPTAPGRPGAVGFSDHQDWEKDVTDRPSRVRAMAPAEVEQRAAQVGSYEAELVLRLEQALGQLPEPERVAVVSAIAFAGGSVGAAMELGLEVDDADALTRNGLQLLRAALADLDPHGQPL